MALLLTPALEERLDHLAEQTRRGRDELAEEGISRFLAHREALEQAVEKGRSAAQRGEVIDHVEAMAMMDEVVAQG